MIEFWLSFNNGAEKLRLPVPPSTFSIIRGTEINTININSVGEVGIIGKGKLATIQLNSFFPNQEYSFVQYRGFLPPYDNVKLIEKWRNSGKPIRLIITETDINIACMIESFEYGEEDGTGDVYFTLSLKEFRFIKVTQVNTAVTRNVDKEVPKFYVVKSGDTLWGIAKKLFGDGSKWKQIADKNNIKDATRLIVGTKLVI